MIVRNLHSADHNILRLTDKKLNKTDVSRNHVKADSTFSNKFNKVCPKRDTIQLSHRRVSVSPSLSKIRDSILSEINGDTNIHHIESLKARINAGRYEIAADELAQSIISEQP